MASASTTLMPDLTMATPVIRPQAAMPVAAGVISCAAPRRAGWLWLQRRKRPRGRAVERRAGLNADAAQEVCHSQPLTAGALQLVHAQQALAAAHIHRGG